MNKNKNHIRIKVKDSLRENLCFWRESNGLESYYETSTNEYQGCEWLLCFVKQ